MKNFLKVQARCCLICGLFALALESGFAQEPTTKNPNTPTPATQPQTTVTPDVSPSLKSPSDTIKPRERIKVDNTRVEVSLDSIRPADDKLIQLKTEPATGIATADAGTLVRAWPESARMAAEATIAKYGQPTLATDDMLMWKGNYTGGLLFQLQQQAASGDPDKMAGARTPVTPSKNVKAAPKKN